MNLKNLDLKKLKAEVKKEIQRRKYEESYYEFFKRAVEELEPETDWTFNWHIKLACDKLQEHVERIIRKEKSEYEGLIVNIPPSSSKSMIFSVCITAWAWIHAPHLRIGGNSYNERLSTDHTIKSRDLILTHFYQDFWGEKYTLKRDQNQKTEFSNDKGGLRKSRAETGRHFDIIIVDDILNPKLASSEVERESASNLFFKTIPSRFKNPGKGLKVVVMQRLHEQDIVGKIEEKGLNYEKIVVPAEYDEEILHPAELKENYKNNLFWADRFTIDFLESQKKNLGPLEYSGQYQQLPSPADGTIFQKDWFRLRFDPDTIPDFVPMHFVSDTSYGQDEVEMQKKDRKPDKSITIAFKVYNNNLYIYYMHQTEMGFYQYRHAYPEFVKSCGGDTSSLCFFEPKASGRSMVQELRRSTGLNVLEDFAPKDSKEVRARNISVPKLASNRVFFNQNQDWEELIKQHLSFPAGRFKDIVDTLTMACHKIDKLPTVTLVD